MEAIRTRGGLECFSCGNGFVATATPTTPQQQPSPQILTIGNPIPMNNQHEGIIYESIQSEHYQQQQQVQQEQFRTTDQLSLLQEDSLPPPCEQESASRTTLRQQPNYFNSSSSAQICATQIVPHSQPIMPQPQHQQHQAIQMPLQALTLQEHNNNQLPSEQQQQRPHEIEFPMKLSSHQHQQQLSPFITSAYVEPPSSLSSVCSSIADSPPMLINQRQQHTHQSVSPFMTICDSSSPKLLLNNNNNIAQLCTSNPSSPQQQQHFDCQRLSSPSPNGLHYNHHFNHHHLHHNDSLGLEQYISKRNERERSRVRNVNCAFENLKKSLPLDGDKHNKRMSKVEILRTAINYIRNLEEVLDTKEQQQQFRLRSKQHQESNEFGRV